MPESVLSPGAVALGLRADPLGTLGSLAKEMPDGGLFRWGNLRTWWLPRPEQVREVMVAKARSFSKWFPAPATRELLGEGLLVSDGDFHRRQRKLATPAFHGDRIRTYGETMAEIAREIRDGWIEGETVDVAAEMNRYAVRVVTRTLFGADIEKDADRVSAALSRVFDLLRRAAMPPDEVAEFQALIAELDAVVLRIVRERRATGEDRGDLLSMLLLAADAETGETMDDRQIRDEAMTLFLAGHETAATALGWAWHLLGEHWWAAERVREEARTVFSGGEPAPDRARDLAFAAQVFRETLRLYPPIWSVGRMALEPVRIGDFVLEEGDAVAISAYFTHRDARWFPEPERFDPGRWADPAAVRTHPAYFPFSWGTRSCIGEGFALMEALLMLATVSQRWRLEPVQGAQPEVSPQLTLRAKNGIRMRVTGLRAEGTESGDAKSRPGSP